MKKTILLSICALFLLAVNTSANASEISFPKAIKTCEPYSQTGSVQKNGEIFNIKITLEKTKNRCVYKEKVYQSDKYHLLTCEFIYEHLPFMSDSMARFNKEFQQEISKNRIFEAKMTTNSEIFNKYIINPQYCNVTQSKK